MLPHERLKLLKMQKLKGYPFYAIFLLILWFSESYVFNIITISLGVIYIVCHQGYFFYKRNKLEDIKIGF